MQEIFFARPEVTVYYSPKIKTERRVTKTNTRVTASQDRVNVSQDRVTVRNCRLNVSQDRVNVRNCRVTASQALGILRNRRVTAGNRHFPAAFRRSLLAVDSLGPVFMGVRH